MTTISALMEKAEKDLTKKFGVNALVTLSAGSLKGIPVQPTGVPSLDEALGVGGLPKGRIVEIYGQESSGKTTVCLKTIAMAQKAGQVCAVIDVEHALDPAWAKVQGVDIDSLFVSQPECGEDALEIAKWCIDNNMGLVVVDSVSNLVPRAELEGDFGDSHMALQARMMSQAMRKLTGLVNKKQAILMFTNQIRSKIGVMFGSPLTTSGGNALKFYASVRLDVSRIGSDKTGEKETEIVHANRVKVKVVKNKVAPPFKVCEFKIDFEYGLQTAVNLFQYLIDEGHIEKAGSWFSYKGEKLGQGERNAFQKFTDEYDADAIYDNIQADIADKKNADSEPNEKLDLYQAKLEKAEEAGDEAKIKKYKKLIAKLS
jgi:recombination protein RecA